MESIPEVRTHMGKGKTRDTFSKFIILLCHVVCVSIVLDCLGCHHSWNVRHHTELVMPLCSFLALKKRVKALVWVKKWAYQNIDYPLHCPLAHSYYLKALEVITIAVLHWYKIKKNNILEHVSTQSSNKNLRRFPAQHLRYQNRCVQLSSNILDWC